MIRDRTNLYLAYRKTFPRHGKFLKKSGPSNGAKRIDRFKHLPQEEEGLLNGSGEDAGIELTEFRNVGDTSEDGTKDYTAVIQDIEDKGNTLIRQIKQNMKMLSKKYKEVLLPQFDDDIVQNEMNAVNDLSNVITNKLRMIYKVISELQKLDEIFVDLELEEQNNGFHDNDSGKGIKGSRILVSNLKKKFAIVSQDLSGEFREMQGKYIKYLKKDELITDSPKYKDAVELDGVGLADGANDIESYSRNAMVESSTKQSQLQTQIQQTQNHDDLDQEYLLEREREIYKISQNVIEISLIFKELENIVIDQGTVLDNIEYNIDRTIDNVKGANQQLDKAEGYQKQTRKCKLVMLLVLLIFLFLMLLMVKPRRTDHYIHDGNNNNNDVGLPKSTEEPQSTHAVDLISLPTHTSDIEPIVGVNNIPN